MITGDQDWAEKTYSVSSGIHTLKWRYVKDSSGYAGDDEARVDFVQWSGAAPVPDSDNWQQLDFKCDVAGRRSEKQVDGYGTRYLYDGPHVIAEYDGHPQDGLAATTCCASTSTAPESTSRSA